MKTLRALLFLGLFATAGTAQEAADGGHVKYLPCPNGGVRPIVETEPEKLLVHVLYHSAFAPEADLYYMRSEDGGFEFSEPVRVNSIEGSVDATDQSRGGDIAFGRDGKLYVVWIGSAKAEPRGPEGETPLMFSRLAADGESFEAERNLISTRWGLTAAPAVTADANGAVHIFWHAPGEAPPEGSKYNDRVVYWIKSSDDGETFTDAERIDDRKPKGVADNSSVDARIDEDGTIYVFFRSGQTKQKDMRLLYRPTTSDNFGSFYVDTWRRMRPPEATSSIKAGHDRLVMCWETEGAVYSAMISRQSHRNVRPLAPMGRKVQRTRVVSTFGPNNISIMAWMEGPKDAEPTRLAWRLFDNATYGPLDRGYLDDVPSDAVPDAFVRPDGGFTVVY